LLVNGTVRAHGGRIRVSVEALRTASGQAIWSQRFERAADSLLGIEEAVATEVASGVAGRLSPRERRVLGSRATTSSRAYQQFLRGNVLLARQTRASLEGAVAAYQAAVAADSGFADAFARLSYAYADCAFWGGCGGDGESLLRRAGQAANRALQLDPRSSDAWMARGHVLSSEYLIAEPHPQDSLVPGVLAALRRAVTLGPRNDEAYHQYGSTLTLVSDSAALEALRRALALNPARAVTYQNTAVAHYVAGRLDLALATLDSALVLEPDLPGRGLRVLYRLVAGDTAGALSDARLAPGMGYSPLVLATVGHDSAAAREMESRIAQPLCRDVLAPLYLLWTGRREPAVQLLLRCGPSLFARVNLRSPAYAPLLNDPRIRALRAASDSIPARVRWR